MKPPTASSTIRVTDIFSSSAASTSTMLMKSSNPYTWSSITDKMAKEVLKTGASFTSTTVKVATWSPELSDCPSTTSKDREPVPLQSFSQLRTTPLTAALTLATLPSNEMPPLPLLLSPVLTPASEEEEGKVREQASVERSTSSVTIPPLSSWASGSTTNAPTPAPRATSSSSLNWKLTTGRITDGPSLTLVTTMFRVASSLTTV
mmetsp:Transcript_15032/g.27977  ORF Transcript_15032/g.27977 Transcript_15032/m.27977 type:complete len:205 (-) Transcript_15032:3915-4529(-)